VQKLFGWKGEEAMTKCDFCHPENYCEYEDACKLRGKMRKCNAKPQDLIEICENCYQPVEDCDCGTNWVLVNDKEGVIFPITPKDYKMLGYPKCSKRGVRKP